MATAVAVAAAVGVRPVPAVVAQALRPPAAPMAVRRRAGAAVAVRMTRALQVGGVAGVGTIPLVTAADADEALTMPRATTVAGAGATMMPPVTTVVAAAAPMTPPPGH